MRCRPCVLAALFAASAAVFAMERPASACSVAPVVNALVMPPDGATDVPINARVWLTRFEVGTLFDDVVLRADDGRLVELDVEDVDFVMVATPSTPLEPLTHYELIACIDGACAQRVRGFVTSSDGDLEPPPLPLELDRREQSGWSCGRSYWYELELDFEGVVALDFGVPEFDADAITGRDVVLTTEHEFVVEDRFIDETRVRAGAFDVAGNFSGWVELEPLAELGCGCRTDSTPRGWWWIALLLMARRRRTSFTLCVAIAVPACRECDDPAKPGSTSTDSTTLASGTFIDASTVELVFSAALSPAHAVEQSHFRLSMAHADQYRYRGRCSSYTYYCDLSNGFDDCEYCSFLDGCSRATTVTGATIDQGDPTRVRLSVEPPLDPLRCFEIEEIGDDAGILLHYSAQGTGALLDAGGHAVPDIAAHWVLEASAYVSRDGAWPELDAWRPIPCPRDFG